MKVNVYDLQSKGTYFWIDFQSIYLWYLAFGRSKTVRKRGPESSRNGQLLMGGLKCSEIHEKTLKTEDIEDYRTTDFLDSKLTMLIP